MRNTGFIIVLLLIIIVFYYKPSFVKVLGLFFIIYAMSMIQTTSIKGASENNKINEHNEAKNYVTNIDDDFPYKSRFIKESPHELFEKLKAVNLIDMPNATTINVQANELYAVDVITDLFAEPMRVRVPVYGHPSPKDYYTQNKAKVKAIANKKYRKITPYSLRETLYELTKEATLFKASLSKFIYDTFTNTHEASAVLDPCAGWGDRLIGALASSRVASYTATDTNELMQPVYNAIHTTLAPDKETTVHNLDFFKFKSDIKYDLVFTSPPFYNFELYDGMPLEPSSTYEEWLNQWLIPFTDKCISHCALDGRVMLYLGNTYQTPNMVETVTSQFRAAVIDVYNLPKKRPIQLLDIKPVQLVYVDQLNKSELRQLQGLVSDENVMKWVADGRVWPRAKLDKFIAYSQEESKNRDAATNHWFGIINGLTLSGIVGIHKNINNAWSITIYMNTTKQGQGIGKHAIKLLLEKFNDVKPIYIHTKKTNEPMNKLAMKLGFTPTNAFRDGYNSYIAE